jgi:hypothetical protein
MPLQHANGADAFCFLFCFDFPFGHGMAQEMENGTIMLKRSWNTGTSSYAQRARTNFTTKFATNSLFTLLPHRCVSVLCYMALYVFARLWAAVLDGWLAYNKSCFNSSSMHICFGNFFFVTFHSIRSPHTTGLRLVIVKTDPWVHPLIGRRSKKALTDNTPMVKYM